LPVVPTLGRLRQENHLSSTWATQGDPVSKDKETAGCWWLMPVILATQEAKIRRIIFRSQSRQIVQDIPSQKYPTQNRLNRVAQARGTEFKSQYYKKMIIMTNYDTFIF
jgi:hypothetical protein